MAPDECRRQICLFINSTQRTTGLAVCTIEYETYLLKEYQRTDWTGAKESRFNSGCGAGVDRHKAQ